MECELEQWPVCQDRQGQYGPARPSCSDRKFSNLAARYKGGVSEIVSANPPPIPKILFREPQNEVQLQ